MNAYQDENGGFPKARDWLGWAVLIAMTIVTGLSGIAWNALNRRVDNIEMYGSAPMRVQDAKIAAQIEAHEQAIRDLQQQVKDLNTALYQRSYRSYQSSPPEPSSGPRFSRP